MESDIRYAGFWVRTLAIGIDSLWLYAVTYIPLWFLMGPGIASAKGGFSLTRFTFEWIVPAIMVLGFWIITSSTPGKMLFEMRIVDAETFQPVSPARLCARYLGYFVSAFPMGLGFLWVALDKKKQGWHDKIARTVVVREDCD